MVFLVIFLTQSTLRAENLRTGLAENPSEKNISLLVGPSATLSGIDLDISMVKEMLTHPGYNFQINVLRKETATLENVQSRLTQYASEVGQNGTLLFYFSGHGSDDATLAMYKTPPYVQSMHIKQIRKAIEDGRKTLGPLKRLVLLIDACYSGSLIPDIHSREAQEENQKQADAIAENIIAALQPETKSAAYYDKLVVFVSSRSDQTSAASPNGSYFTQGLSKAFKEAIVKKSTIGEFIAKTKQSLPSPIHNPVEYLSPQDLANELMLP